MGLWIKIRHLRKKGDCLTSLTRFREINQDLVGLSGQQSAPPCAVGERSRKLQKLPNAYQSIRDYAINLQEVFREELPSLTCKCEGASAHSVNMRLQTVKDKGGQHLDTGSLKYVVYFSFEMNTATIARLPWDWRDPEAPPETQYVYAAPPTLAMAVQLQTTKLKLPITAEESKKKNPKGVLSKLKSSYSGYSIAHAKSAIKK